MRDAGVNQKMEYSITENKHSTRGDMKEMTLSLVIRGFLLIVLIDLVLIAAVAGIGWWTGWTELAYFQRAIQVAGLLVIALGFLGLIGKRNQLDYPENQERPTEASHGSRDLPRQRILGISGGYSFLLVMFMAGLVCLIIGWLM